MIRAILTDIEGTTSSLSFVKDVLFPYARQHLPAYVRAHAQDAAVRTQLIAVNEAVGRTLDLEEAITQLITWIDEDRKITPLKTLQGYVWQDGYARGDFKGHVYEDAVQHLHEWKSRGLNLCIFSSGSIQAQKLLFAHTAFGDLTRLFSGYFDTTIGSKRERESYARIAQAMNLVAGDVLFLSDIREELDAAREAGMQTCWLVRDGALPENPTHRVARNFNEIDMPVTQPA